MGNKYKELAGNTLIFAICNFTAKLLVFFMLPFYTAVLSREEFGTADLITSTVSLLQPILTIAIAEACMRFALDKAKDAKQVFAVGLKTILIGMAIIIVASPLLKKLPGLDGYMLYFVGLYVTTILNSFLNYFGRGIQKVKIVGIAGVVSAFTAVGCNVLLLFVFHLGIAGYLLSMIIAHFAASCVLFWGGKMTKYLSWETPVPLTKEMVQYSLPLVPNKLSWWINHLSNRYILNHFCGVADVGLYSAAARMPSIIDTFRGIFIEAWQLSTITEYDKKDSDAFFNNIFRAYNVFMLLLTSGLIVFSKALGRLLYSKEFFQAWELTPLLLLSVFFGSLVSFYSPIYLAHKKTNRLFLFTLAGAIITVVCNFVLVPILGVRGAATASVISYFSIYLSMAIDSKKYVALTADSIVYKVSYALLALQAALITFGVIMPMSILSWAILFALLILNFGDIRDMSSRLFGALRNRFIKHGK